MKGRVWVFVALALILSLVFYFNVFGTKDLFIKIDNVITGNPILADDGFVKDAKDFKTGGNFVLFNNGGASLSPDSSSPSDSLSSSENSDLSDSESNSDSDSDSDSDSECVIKSVSWSEKTVEFGGNVQIVAYGEGCDKQKFDVEVFEKDTFFRDKVVVLEGSFENGRALIDFETSGFDYLFDEIFEGEELEIYFETDFNDVELVSSLMIVFKEEEGVLLQSFTSYPIGKGCTTAWYIDEDCDGYGVGIQSGGQYGRFSSDIYGNMPDADDTNSLVNTPQSVIQLYGDPSQNIQNLRDFLITRGYNANNIFIVDPVNGNDATAQINNVNFPFRTWEEIKCEGGLVNNVPVCVRAGANGAKSLEIQHGDIVLFRGGDYITYSLGTETPRHNFVSGTVSRPIVLMAYPGEAPKLISFYGLGFIDSENMIADGFILTCEAGLGSCEGSAGLGHVGISIGGSGKNWIFRNNEILKHKWGIWGGIPKDNIIIEKNVIHDNSGEHGIYVPNSNADPMTNFIIRDNLVYRNRRHGMQFNGKMDNFLVENNLIHSNGLGGITLTNGFKNGIVKNNLIFNNNRQGIILFGYCDSAYFNCASTDSRGCLVGLVPECPSSTTSCSLAAYPQCFGDGADFRDSNDNNLIVNNLIWVGSAHTGVCEEQWDPPPCSRLSNPSDFSAIDVADNTPRDVYTFTGNIFRNNIFRNTNAPIFRTDRLNHFLSPGTLIENNLFFRETGEPAGLASAVTDSSHSGSYITGGINYYTWTFNGFQNHWSTFIRNNVLGNPQFMDALTSYALTPGLYNFDYLSLSPAINLGIFNNAPLNDIRGRSRLGNVDAGVYEYDPLSAQTPYLMGITPNHVRVGSTGGFAITFNGYNFNPLAELEVCAPDNVCDPIPNSALYNINSNRIVHDFVTYSIATGLYTFRVRNPDNQFSLTKSVMVQGVPASPTVLVSNSISYNSVSLSWTDNSNDEDGFYIERSLLPTSGFTQIGVNNVNDNTFTDNTVSSGTTYYYRVRAFNYEANSGYSNIISGTTSSGPPNAPTNLYTYPIDANSIQITWVDTSSNEEGFYIQFMTPTSSWSPIPNLNLGLNIVSAVHTGLSENIQYTYRIRSFAGTAFSSWSNTDYSITPPNTPTNLVVTRLSSTQARLDWRDNSNGELRFKVQRCIGAGCTNFADLSGATNLPANTVTAPSTVTYTDNTLSSGVEYVYRVRAEQSWWSSLWSNTASTVSGISVPNVPSGLTAVALSATSMRLNWNDNSNNEQGFTLQYKLSSAPESSWADVPGASNLPSGNGGAMTYPQITGLVANTAYNYRVRAYNAVGNSAWFPASAPYPTGTTFVCNPNQQESCSEHRGVCAGTMRTCSASGQWGTCSYSSQPGYASVETGASLCIDRLDNDCDGEGDYDGAGVPGVTHGDNGCAVSITGINAPVPQSIPPNTVFTSSNFNLDCTSSPSNVNSIIGTLDGVSCGFVNWFVNVARFNCASSSTPRVQVATCDIDTSKSYRTGTAINSNVNVVSNACSSYTTSSSCESISGNICDWVLGCSITNPTWSNGFGNRCVPAGTGTGNYMCRATVPATSCGATCDGTLNGCSQTQSCDLNSCGCVEQNPNINLNGGVSPNSFAWGSNGVVVTVTGNYFASNAELLVDGNPVIVLSSTRTATSLQFNYGNRMFRTGEHLVTVKNPTSGRVSNSATLTLNSNPTISSIVPNVLSYTTGGSVDIVGTDLDPYRLLVNGLLVPESLWGFVNPTLVRLLIVGGIVPGGDYDFVAVNRDNVNSISSSFNNRLRINWLFDYYLTLSSSGAVAPPQSSFDIDVNLQSVDFMAYEDVIVTVNFPPEITVAPKGLDRCTPNLNCVLSYTVNVGNVVAQDYVVTFTGTSEQTSKEHSQILTIRGEVSGGGSSGGSSGGGSGGGGGGRPKLTSAQCNDKKDNDVDGLIDFSEDLGCDSLKDNDEINIENIVTKGNYTFGEENETGEEISGTTFTEKDIEIRVVFWLTVLILVIGIAIIGIVIMRYVRRERRIRSLMNKDDWR